MARELVNTLKAFAEEKTGVKITESQACVATLGPFVTLVNLEASSFEFLTDRRCIKAKSCFVEKWSCSRMSQP